MERSPTSTETPDHPDCYATAGISRTTVGLLGPPVRVWMRDVSPHGGVAIELFLFEPVGETGRVVVGETRHGDRG